MTPETKLKNAITKYLKSLGKDLWFFKVAGGPFQKAGVPDIVGCYRGRFFALENKAPTGKTSPKQDREIDLIRKAGGAVIVPYSIDQVVGFMEAM